MRCFTPVIKICRVDLISAGLPSAITRRKKPQCTMRERAFSTGSTHSPGPQDRSAHLMRTSNPASRALPAPAGHMAAHITNQPQDPCNPPGPLLAAAHPGNDGTSGALRSHPSHHTHTSAATRTPAVALPVPPMRTIAGPAIALPVIPMRTVAHPVFSRVGSLQDRHSSVCNALCGALSKRSRAECRQNECQTEHGRHCEFCEFAHSLPFLSVSIVSMKSRSYPLLHVQKEQAYKTVRRNILSSVIAGDVSGISHHSCFNYSPGQKTEQELRSNLTCSQKTHQAKAMIALAWHTLRFSPRVSARQTLLTLPSITRGTPGPSAVRRAKL
jgi:hypothetical protein